MFLRQVYESIQLLNHEDCHCQWFIFIHSVTIPPNVNGQSLLKYVYCLDSLNGLSFSYCDNFNLDVSFCIAFPSSCLAYILWKYCVFCLHGIIHVSVILLVLFSRIMIYMPYHIVSIANECVYLCIKCHDIILRCFACLDDLENGRVS